MNAETIVKRHAYSYIRFSSVEQAKGDSFRRQTARTEEFCKSHHLILNDTRYADLGVSGWTGKNMETGALGAFLLALKAGKLEKNSVLVVENFDRFSRLKPRKAYEKLAEIIEAGVDVVTLEDGKFHTKATLDDFATLITSLAIMQRANEESSRKSSLIGASWAQKRKLAVEGKAVMTKNCPSWLRLKADETGFEPIPERLKLVHRIIRLVKEGKGKREIARMLDAEKVPTWSWAKCWRDNYILELVRSRALLGELHLQKRKHPNAEPVKNYYPAVVDEATWLSIQPEKRKVFNAGPQSDANNLFSGLLFDGYNPDFHMRFFLTDKAKNYIYLTSDYATVDPLYLERSKAIANGKKPGARPLSGTSIKYRDFEEHFMRHFSEIDLHDTLPVKPVAESSRLALLEADKKENDKALAAWARGMVGGKPLDIVMQNLEKHETIGKRLAKELAEEAQKQKVEQHAADSFEEEQKRLTELLEASTREARLSLRAMLHRMIERIDIYTAGLLDVPDNLKTAVYPDRNGMMCYSVKLIGSYKIWIWWDGHVQWE
jgi:DNA invertase Pin-like site-specific DNA recombinase